MKTLILAAIRCSLMFTSVAALSLAYPAPVQAVPTTYQYTGNPFTIVTGPYSTSDFVTAMVTLANPLPPNTPLTQVTPLAFTFSDGVQTITNQEATGSFFAFATGPTGMITFWQDQVIFSGLRIMGEISNSILTFREPVGGLVVDAGFADIPERGMGRNVGAPGTWATAGVPDVGSSLALLSLFAKAVRD